jgi:twinfilin
VLRQTSQSYSQTPTLQKISASSKYLSETVVRLLQSSARGLSYSTLPETLVHDLTVPVGGPFEEDLSQIQTLGALEDAVPAYILARLAPSDWVLVCYVPDSATVRDKVSIVLAGPPNDVSSTDIQMLYASTRSSLSKSLGSTLFTDTIFASSRADLTPEAYAAHRRHLTAPKPLSAREQEIANVRAAESSGSYNGSRTRANHVGTGVDLQWTQEVAEAVKHLTASNKCAIVVVVCSAYIFLFHSLIGSE